MHVAGTPCKGPGLRGAEFGRKPLMRCFASGADSRPLGRPFKRKPDEPEPLASSVMIAAARGDVEGMRRLLDPSMDPPGIIDVNSRADDGTCALGAAVFVDSYRVLQMLIDAGADVGATQLIHLAAETGSFRCLPPKYHHRPRWRSARRATEICNRFRGGVYPGC